MYKKEFAVRKWIVFVNMLEQKETEYKIMRPYLSKKTNSFIDKKIKR